MKKRSLKSLNLNKKSISNLDIRGGISNEGASEEDANEGFWSNFSRFNHLCDLVSQGPGCRSLHHCPDDAPSS